MNRQENNPEQAEQAAVPETKPQVKQEPVQSAPPKKELTPAQMQKRRKRVVMPLFFLVFAGAMGLIFAPSNKEEKAAGQEGFNAEIPTPASERIYSDKLTAYRQEAVRENEQEKMRSLQDFSALFGSETETETEQERLTRQERELRLAPKPVEYYEHPELFEGGASSARRSGSLQASAAANEAINRQLGAWYEEPADAREPSVAVVEQRMQELERRLAEAEAREAEEDETAALLEKSYEMAARYVPGTSGATEVPTVDGSAAPQGGRSTRAAARPVGPMRRSVVSLLSVPMSDDEFIDTFGQPRNVGFVTAARSGGESGKNTIRACADRTVTLTDGKELPIRLLEPMMADGVAIPPGTVIIGACGIEGERMEVTVSSIQYGGNIIPVELSVYDPDGQRGIRIPRPVEIDAAKEAAATMARSAGTGITISDDAPSQLAADMGKGLIQGISQYVAGKMSIVRVTVKAGYGLLLLPSAN
jgi:conjugative transposon TraM protein